MSRLAEIRLEQIIVRDNIRRSFDRESIKELTSSIERYGILQPVVVEERQDQTYKLVLGERRFLAARRAGMETIPAIVVDDDLEPDETVETQLVENLHRKGLDPLDEAEAYQQLNSMGYSVSKIAERVGKSRYYISKRLRLLRLHPEIREKVRQRKITPGHAQTLLRLDPQQQLALAEEIIKRGLSEKEARHRTREILGKELSWRLVPVRLSLTEFRLLERIAPEGNVETLVKETITRLMRDNS